FQGEVYLLAIYTRTLNNSEVLRNFEAEIGNSVPIVANISVTINEDGETGNHYDEPEYYLADVPFTDLPVISLGVYDADHDQGNPNIDKELPLPRIFVLSLPAKGNLYNISGTPISYVPYEVALDETTYNMKYRPERDEYSSDEVYTSFEYYAIDGKTSKRSIENATVTVHVLPKNDPPRAFNITTSAVVGTKNNIVFLDGEDQDVGDLVQDAVVSHGPVQGNLYQVYQNGSVSDTLIVKGQILWTQRVAYEYGLERLKSNTPGFLSFGVDNFSFQVLDSYGNGSVESFVTLGLKGGVHAYTAESQGDSSWICYEDTKNTVTMYGESAGDEQGDLTFVIYALPANGTLYDPTSGATLSVGDHLTKRIPYPYKEGCPIVYYPYRNFFTSPSNTWNGPITTQHTGHDNFSFYVSARAGDANVSSNIVSQMLKVVNVNDNITITCPHEEYQTQAIGFSLDAYNNSQYDTLYFDNFSIMDKDRGVDAVHVSVQAEYGILSLNSDSLSMLDFTSLTHCFSNPDWICKGSGLRNQEMEFVAQPESLQMALNGMMYQSYTAGVVDNITFTIYDGE
ncbi:unnamed protein product, partial [Discosporangium mesarthrocarpum]